MGCRATRTQGELVRLVRSADGDIDLGRTAPGRGAWLCAATATACLDQAVKRKAFGRAFRGPVRTGATERLRAYLAERERMDGRGC